MNVTTPTLPTNLSDQRILRPLHAAEMLGCSRSHLYRLAKGGELPPPIRISHGVSGWRASDILALIARREASYLEEGTNGARKGYGEGYGDAVASGEPENVATR